MKWFFALCSESKDCKRTIEHLKVSVNSAIQNTDLEPYLLYDGKEDELTKWLTNKGVNVIITQVSYIDTLINNPKFESIGTARGAYLRTEVPMIAKQLKLKDKYILYTDCDVLFTENSTDIFNLTPEYFACAPEFKIDDYSYFNTGVMLINVDNMQKTYKSFTNHIKARCKSAAKPLGYTAGKEYNPDEGNTHAAYDQSMYNEFYKDTFSRLPPEYNWKPYWGYNKNAKIIHFHGPKIDTIRVLQDVDLPNVLMYLYYIGQENDSGYSKYKTLFDSHNKNT